MTAVNAPILQIQDRELRKAILWLAEKIESSLEGKSIPSRDPKTVQLIRDRL